MPISEVRKCSRLLTPVNSLIDQLHHCVVGTCWFVLVLVILPSLSLSHNANVISLSLGWDKSRRGYEEVYR